MPNLFIIGAPKCGTTSLSAYLAMHPEIYMSEQAGNKEPEHFSTDLWPTRSKIYRRSEYLNLFASASSSTKLVGEASVNYLYSQVAVGNILKESPDAKLVVMLRNPVDMAHSLHLEHVKNGSKAEIDFETAWRLQNDRRNGRRLPSWCTDYRVFMYSDRARLGSQLDRLLDAAPRSQVHVIFYDDLRADPEGTCRRLLRFLQVESAANQEFPRINSSSDYRLPLLEGLLLNIKEFRTRVGIPGGLGLHQLLRNINRKPGKPKIKETFRQELQRYFREEVELLEKLTDRNLEHWLQ